MDCLFCKIIDGEIPSNKVYEDDMMLAFRDINPQAPEHIVIVPKCHIASANEINAENVKYVAAIWEKIPQIASELGFAENGYRVVNFRDLDSTMQGLVAGTRISPAAATGRPRSLIQVIS